MPVSAPGVYYKLISIFFLQVVDGLPEGRIMRASRHDGSSKTAAFSTGKIGEIKNIYC